jgi:3-oxoacyl-[acyl-carrier protein] reductase
MDMGIRGRNAIVCAASAGLGMGCAQALAQEGAKLVMNARDPDRLEATARGIRVTTGATIVTVAADITSEEGRRAVLAACPQPDILVNNAGGPPIGSFQDFDQAMWLVALNMAMLTPIAMIKATVNGMIKRKFGRIINITSGAVKAPVPSFDLSNGARAGLTGFVGGLARQVACHNVTINNLLPGQFETARLDATLDNDGRLHSIPPERARAERLEKIPARRFGKVEEFGAACVFLASDHAGYVIGQNLLLDGGHYPGTF